MLTKLEPEEYVVFVNGGQFDVFPLISSVCQGRQQGSIYVDNKTKPNLVFVIHKVGFAYLYATASFAYDSFINFITLNEDVPQYFHVYDPDSEFVKHTVESSSVNHKLRERVQLRYNESENRRYQIAENQLFELHAINENNISLLSGFGIDLIKTFWGSEERFLSDGYGVFLTNKDNQAVSLCYSACVTNQLSEIDIVTHENYRNQGLAKYVTSAYIDLSIRKNILPNWDCFTDNVSSYKTALSLGFETLMKYNFLSVYLKNRK
jgi:hypothetical protein